MISLPKSATKTLFSVSTAIPIGLLKVAALPVPSARPAAPLPASVVTVPSGVIFLMRLLPWSATYKLSLALIARPLGLLNRAFVPFPSAKPYVPPAKVVVVPGKSTSGGVSGDSSSFTVQPQMLSVTTEATVIRVLFKLVMINC